MDGYALAAGGPTGSWDVVGESAAGAPYAGSIMAGQAVRIFTGAPLPRGADTIIIQENAEPQGEAAVRIAEPANPIPPNNRVDFKNCFLSIKKMNLCFLVFKL